MESAPGLVNAVDVTGKLAVDVVETPDTVLDAVDGIAASCCWTVSSGSTDIPRVATTPAPSTLIPSDCCGITLPRSLNIAEGLSFAIFPRSCHSLFGQRK